MDHLHLRFYSADDSFHFSLYLRSHHLASGSKHLNSHMRRFHFVSCRNFLRYNIFRHLIRRSQWLLETLRIAKRHQERLAKGHELAADAYATPSSACWERSLFPAQVERSARVESWVDAAKLQYCPHNFETARMCFRKQPIHVKDLRGYGKCEIRRLAVIWGILVVHSHLLRGQEFQFRKDRQFDCKRQYRTVCCKSKRVFKRPELWVIGLKDDGTRHRFHQVCFQTRRSRPNQNCILESARICASPRIHCD